MRPLSLPENSSAFAYKDILIDQIHWTLARYLRSRPGRSKELQDEELFSLYAQLAYVTQAVSSGDLSAATAWIRVAENCQHPTLLLAF